MSEPDDERDPLEVLAAEFVERQRKGQCPSISEYAVKHPELAAEIEEFFPTIAALEELKSHKEEASGARASLGALKLERLGDFRILGEIGRGGRGSSTRPSRSRWAATWPSRCSPGNRC